MSRLTLLIVAILGCAIGDIIVLLITLPLISEFIDVVSYTIIFGFVITIQIVYLVWLYFDMTKVARDGKIRI